MFLKSLVLITALSNLSVALAHANVKTCEGADIQHVKTWLNPRLPKLGQLDFKYQVAPGTDPHAPTVIVLPGGPGQESIHVNQSLGAIPLQLTRIYTDPRGTGCNRPGAVPDELYDTDFLADDVVSVIAELVRKQGLKDYLVYGGSFGTLLGTKVVAALERTNLPQPRALVLEGVLGRGSRASDYLARIHAELARVKGLLPAAARARLDRVPLPLGFNEQQWGNIFFATLITGEAFGVGDLTTWALSPLAQTDDPALYDPTILKALTAIANPAFEATRMSVVIPCREIYPDKLPSPTGLSISNGDFVVSDKDACEGISRNVPLFDSRDYQLHTKIYYFEGDHDLATAPFLARYHFENQKAAERFYVRVPEASHAVLTQTLGPCTGKIWQAIATGQGFEEAVASCQIPWPGCQHSCSHQTVLETRHPGE